MTGPTRCKSNAMLYYQRVGFTDQCVAFYDQRVTYLIVISLLKSYMFIILEKSTLLKVTKAHSRHFESRQYHAVNHTQRVGPICKIVNQSGEVI